MSGGFNVGSDTKLTILSGGIPLVSQRLTSFEARQITSKLKSVKIDGVNDYRELEEGWEGMLGYDRADSSLEDYFAAKEAGRYAGLQPPKVTITETTTNVDGSIVKYRYERVTLKMDSRGTREGDKKVEVKISWTASRQFKVL